MAPCRRARALAGTGCALWVGRVLGAAWWHGGRREADHLGAELSRLIGE